MNTQSKVILLDRRLIRSHSMSDAVYMADAACSGGLTGVHQTVSRNARGRIMDIDESHNLLTTAGKNSLIGVGVHNDTQIPTWYQGLHVENRHITDAVTNGSTTLTSATASFVSEDAGRLLTVYGAGAAGGSLVTTIASYSSGTTVIMSNAATDTASGHTATLGGILVVADTAASHAGWVEISSALITNGTRPAWVPGVASAGACTGPTTPTAFTMAASIANQYIHGFFTASISTLAGATGTLLSEGSYTGGALVVGSSYTITDTYTVTLT
ncbi:MAG TPA: hypothetical protein VIH90_03375 [Candidatus Saccharimonadales bacterium]